MNIILYTSDSIISVSNVIHYEIKNEKQEPETIEVPKKKKRKKKDNSSEQLSLDNLMIETKVEEEPIEKEGPAKIDVPLIAVPTNNTTDVPETVWFADAEKVWEYEWPKVGCYPLRRRKLKTVLTENEMVKVNEL